MGKASASGAVLCWTGASLLLVGLAAGCGSPQRETHGATNSGGSQSGANATEITLPIDEYQFTTEEVLQLGRARSLLVGSCMRRFGFTYDPTTEAAQAEQSTKNETMDFGVHRNKRRYGVTDPETATKFGYHLPSTVTGPPSSAPPSKGGADPHGLGGLTPAKQAVLYGKSAGGEKLPPVNGQNVPEGGCIGEATAKLGSNGKIQEPEVVSTIARDSYDRSLNDSGVTTAFSKWSGCMREKGYEYPSPREAGSNFDISSRTVSPQEITTAQVDVACKKQTKLVDVWYAFENEFQKSQIDKHTQDLKKAKSDHDAMVKRTATTLAGG